MGLTPNEILNKEFSTKFRGYDADQVNDYLDIIVADYEKMIEDIHKLKVELSAAKEKNDYFTQLQESLNSSIVVAQEAADRLKQNARKEAELILFEAEKEADKIIIEASDRAKTIVNETEALRRSSKSYRERMENLIRNQLEVVAGEDYINLFNEEFESKLSPADFHEASTRASQRVDAIENEENTFAEVDKVTADLNEAADNEWAFSDNIEDVEDMSPHAETESFEMTDDSHKSMEVQNEEEQDQLNNQEDLQPLESMTEPDHSDDHVLDFEEIDEKEVSESVLGQTIRIELPKQDI